MNELRTIYENVSFIITNTGGFTPLTTGLQTRIIKSTRRSADSASTFKEHLKGSFPIDACLPLIYYTIVLLCLYKTEWLLPPYFLKKCVRESRLVEWYPTWFYLKNSKLNYQLFSPVNHSMRHKYNTITSVIGNTFVWKCTAFLINLKYILFLYLFMWCIDLIKNIILII